MSGFFKPYEGRRPYAFISYSHRDSGKVLEIITELDRRKLRLWYDEGIPAGSDWPKNIERHMRDCRAVLFFLSGTALASPNCYSEISTAEHSGKPILIFPLEKVSLNRSWEELLSQAAALPGPEEAPAADRILSWHVLTRSFYGRWTDSFRKEWLGLGAAVLLLTAASAGLAGLLSGRIDPGGNTAPAATAPVTAPALSAETTAAHDLPAVSVPAPTIDPGIFPVRFPDPQQESAVRSVLGRKEAAVLRPELAAVTELYFCGNQVLRSMDGVQFSPEGSLTVNGADVLLSGKVSDLSVIRLMAYLERLALIGQPLKDVSELNGLVLLQELYLSGSAVSSLSGLTDLPSLAALLLEHTNIRDLTVLESLPSLRTVTVSADMLPLRWTENKPFRVILVP